jgi:iron complex outermembrane receptor protein
MSGGLRYDFRTMTGQSMYLSNYNTPEQQVVPGGTPGAYQQYAGFTNKYSGLSGSIGASYQLPGNNYVKINFAKSFRAPSIDELNSNSLNSGANAYILGYTNLKAEQGYEADIAYGYNGKDVNFELDGFYNHINHFIFQDRLASLNGGDSLVNVAGVFYPVFQYQANSAIITGATAYFNIHPASEKWLEIDNGFTYIYSFLPHQTDSTQYVPLTPAPRLTSKIRLKLSDRNGSVLRDSWLQLGAEHDWEQNRVYSALYTELPSLGYTLYNAGIGTRFINPKTNRTVCSLFLNCTNLFNLAYVDHLSHAQYFWAFNANPVTVTQRDQGIYNMGRNLGLKVIFPIGSHKVSDTEINGTDY